MSSTDVTVSHEEERTIPEPPSIEGIIRTDSVTKQLYSTDASIYEVRPECVFFPFNREDVRAIHRWCDHHERTIIPRGGGTSLSGQSIGKGAIVDYSRHLDEILEWDENEEIVRVEPGVVLENLNEFLSDYGYCFGPDVATANRATIGGMIGNNSAGAHSIRYGPTADHVRSLTCVLSNGEEITVEPISRDEARRRAERDTREGKLYDRIPELVQSHAQRIREEFPELMRNVSGYAVDRFLESLEEGVVDLTQLICGSEGSLGAVVEAELEVVPAVEETALVVLECNSLQEAVRANHEAIQADPLAVELLDDMVLTLAEESREFSRHMDWIQGDPEAVIIVEVGRKTGEEQSLQSRVHDVVDRLRSSDFTGTVQGVLDETLQDHIWKIRKSGLPLLLGISGDRKPTTFVEDTAVDPDRLAEYVSDFQDLVSEYDTQAAFYGHSSVGCLHIRPLINLKESDGVRDMRNLARDVVDLVKDYNGALSGEHGDGRSRSEWLDDFYGESLTQLFHDIKTAFDPDIRLNPGNVVEPERMDRNLRYGAEYEAHPPETVQDFEIQGGFEEIVERCNGSAVCRKENSGTMCPSYMVTGEEKHSTRGRANLLRGLMDGDVSSEALSDGRAESVMELCISCKACKSECPSEVDMAPLKEETLHRVHQEKGARVRERFFAGIGRTARMLASWQPIPNLLLSVPGIEALVKRSLGIAPERDLPQFAPDPFRAFTEESDHEETGKKTVVLYVDTFSGYLESRLARRAIRVLKRFGYQPIVPETPCCGRPYMSKGFLEKARTQVQRTLDVLEPYAEQSVPILTLEPSCYSVLVDDARRYAPGPTAEAVADSTVLFNEFIQSRVGDELNEEMVNPPGDLLLHGHCHQKALSGSDAFVTMMDRVARGNAQFVDAGCCGMAGSFGYEEEHYEHSRRMAERKLLPAVEQQAEGTTVVAPGLSCRQQIQHFTSASVKHPVDVLADAVLAPTEA
jgi:FAD/FMN-containing dehydrogenase/Fe-S oxidoreductase